jgi:hypothetical protein
MAEVMQEWQQRRRGGTAYDGGGGASSGSESNIAIPLGPGEWDEALGLPLCVVCHNVNTIAIRHLSQELTIIPVGQNGHLGERHWVAGRGI